jgi:hypothetical protein
LILKKKNLTTKQFRKHLYRVLSKPIREVDRKYIVWLHGFRCCVKGCEGWPVHAHHVKTRGSGGSDRTAIPLCAQHHVKVHTNGKSACEKKWGKGFFARMIKLFNDKYEKGEKGEFNRYLEKDMCHHAH